MKDLTEQVNGQVPTANKEGENTPLKDAQSDMMPAVNPMDAKAKGLGPDAAKMAGTPNGMKAVRNAQEERADLAAQQMDQAVNPQGQSVDDYYRQQNIQEQTLGQAQENVKAFEEKMKQAGSGAGQVSKYIMEETWNNLREAEQTPYIDKVLSESSVQDEFVNAVGIPLSNITEEQSAEMNTFIGLLLEGKEPTELNLRTLQESLGAENDQVKFENLVTEIKKKTYETYRDIGNQIAEGVIDAEDVTVRQLMEAELITEDDVRDSLGLFNGESLPSDWEEMSYAQIEAAAQTSFRRQSEDIDRQAAMAGLDYDLGSSYREAQDSAKAREKKADTVRFGDQEMSVEEFLDNDRLSEEAQRLRDFDFTLEGEDLDAALKEEYGAEVFNNNPEYYRQIYNTVKANSERKQVVDDAITTTDQAINQVQKAMDDTGIEGIDEILGINLNTWDLDAQGFVDSVNGVEEGKAAMKFINEYKELLKQIDINHPDFLKSLKKGPDESWEDFAERVDRETAYLKDFKSNTGAYSNRVSMLNDNFDNEGNFTGDTEAFSLEYLGFSSDELKKFLRWAKVSGSGFDTKTKAMIDKLPAWIKDGEISKEDIEALGGAYRNGIDLSDLVNGVDINKMFGLYENDNKQELFSIVDTTNADHAKALSGNLKHLSADERKKVLDNFAKNAGVLRSMGTDKGVKVLQDLWPSMDATQQQKMFTYMIDTAEGDISAATLITEMSKLPLSKDQKAQLTKKVQERAKSKFEGGDINPITLQAFKDMEPEVMTYLLKNSPDDVFNMANTLQKKMGRSNGQLTNNRNQDVTFMENITGGVIKDHSSVFVNSVVLGIADALDSVMKKAGTSPSKIAKAVKSLRRVDKALKKNHYNRYIRGNIMDDTWHLHIDSSRNQDGTQKSFGDKTAKKVKGFFGIE